MDFEMATWEMTSLLISPKKVFRSVYYHVCFLSVIDFAQLTYLRHLETNEKHLPSSRPFLHLSSIILLASHLSRMGTRLHTILPLHYPSNTRLHLYPLPPLLTSRCYSLLLPSQPTSRCFIHASAFRPEISQSR